MLTAVGLVVLSRIFFHCAGCCQCLFRADELVGIDGFMTNEAKRMACLAGVSESFEKAQRLLNELAGISVSDESIRLCCHQVAADAKKWTEAEVPAAERFASSPGTPRSKSMRER